MGQVDRDLVRNQNKQVDCVSAESKNNRVDCVSAESQNKQVDCVSAESKSKINQDQVDRDVRNQVTSRGRRPTPPPKIKQVRALI
jgi:hypothetical protein